MKCPHCGEEVFTQSHDVSELYPEPCPACDGRGEKYVWDEEIRHGEIHTCQVCKGKGEV
jgi:DnaJ-class molecular chaperone